MESLYWVIVLMGSAVMILALAWLKKTIWGKEWDPNKELKEKWKKRR
ncbi:hypothetical protein [Ammoniphilus sp. YIM 78166]|nr:hypothetical protein [Ammoniphilus sp. YIM 78166]